MSFADLVASDEPESTSDARVDQRDDEPGSGIVKLADMVARTSAAEARIPSIMPPAVSPSVPPPGSPTPQVMRDESGQFVTQSAVPENVSNTPYPSSPAPKSNAPIFLLIAIVVVAAAVVAFFVMGGEDEEQTSELAKMQAQLKGLESKKEMARLKAELEQAKTAIERDKIAEKLAQQKAKDEAAIKAASGAEKEAQKEEIQESEPKTAKGKKARGRPARAKRGASRKATPIRAKTPSPAKTKDEDDGNLFRTAKTSPKESEPKVPASKKGGSDELDSLLGAPIVKKEKPAPNTKAKTKETKPAAASSAASTPTKAEVRSAMGPIARKAQTCSKYSTGTVQLKITVGNSGRVKRTQALGTFSNTTAGKCTEMIARTVKFKPFSAPSFTYTYPITLR